MAVPKEFETYRWTDYRSWSEEEGWELLEGAAWAMSPAPSRRHQKVLGELFSQFYTHLQGTECEAYTAPLDVKLSSEAEDNTPTVLQPDIVICCDPEKLTNWGLKGAPDLVVEIVSPESGRGLTVRRIDPVPPHSQVSHAISLGCFPMYAGGEQRHPSGRAHN